MPKANRLTRAEAPVLFALKKIADQRSRRQDMPIEVQLAAVTSALKIPMPVDEYQFALAIGRKWAFDYAWPDRKIALEVEGGTFGRVFITGPGTVQRRKGQSIPVNVGTRLMLGGRHNDPAGMEEDCVKYSWAAIFGWCVIRVTTPMIRRGDAATLIEEAFKRHGTAV